MHKNVGVIIFPLALVRLGWRLAHPVPLLPADLPGWQAMAARATHVLLYLLLFLMPLHRLPLHSALRLSGTAVHGLGPVQAGPGQQAAGEWFKLAHLSLQWLLYLVCCSTSPGALQHHLVRKDWVLRRMLTSRGPLITRPAG